MAILASADAKISFTSQLYDLETLERSGGLAADAGYTQANRALKDLSQYDDWSGSWLGPALGGWESRNELIKRFSTVGNKFQAKLASEGKSSPQAILNKVIDAPLPQAMGAKTCEEDPIQAAIDMYGPFWGRFPGAQLLTCHKTAVTLVGSALIGLVVLGALSPYANLLGKIIPKKKRRKR